MYNMNYIESIEKDNLNNILNNKGVYCYIEDANIYISVFGKLVCKCEVSKLLLKDICDILDISLVDNKYLYYFIDIAYDNSFFISNKKSLRL